jgi:glycosyltransferase involved in cell wall biosynthesis
MAEEIRKASMCVFPSYAEAMPLSWLEAMCCGKPVVAYDIGWAPEVVVHNHSGLLVPAGQVDRLADAIIQLLCNLSLAEDLGMNARKRVEEKFSIQRVAAESLDWYRNVISECHA